MSQADDDEADDADEPVEVNALHKIFGFVATYYIISGTVVLFILLHEIKLAKPILEAMGPFHLVGQVIMAIFALLANTVAMGFLALNMDKIAPFFEQS